jgi:hypothetical protein
MAGPCACTDESPPAWIPSRRPQDTAARRWQSNDSAIRLNLRTRSLSLFRNGSLRWTTSTLPPRSPSRPAPGSTPHNATLPTDARRPMDRKVASLPRMTARPMYRVPVDSVAPVCILQRQRQTAAIVGYHNQMHVVGHQAVTDQYHSVELMFWRRRLRYTMRSASQSRINLRAFPRCVTWCGKPTATTRAKRATMRTLSERPPARPFPAAHKALPNARS